MIGEKGRIFWGGKTPDILGRENAGYSGEGKHQIFWVSENARDFVWEKEGGWKMPRIPNHPCSHPGCPRLVPRGQKYCVEHAVQHPEEVRSAASRGYDSKWQKARKRFLQTHPLCEVCLKEGRYVKATDVDHIIPHRGNRQIFWDESNWQALCHSHHSMKTKREDSSPVYHY